MTSPIRKSGEERYGVALVLILASAIFIMAAPESDWSRVVIVALEGAALIAVANAAEARFRVRKACEVLVGFAILISLGSAIVGGAQTDVYVNATSAVLVVLATPIISTGIIRQLKNNGAVTVHTMLGVLCIYLLMTLAFASAFGVIGAAGDGSFFVQGEQYSALRDYLYFSITTITTLGLGDLSPAGDFGRALTAAESLLGQIYLVTVVAVIVGNLGRRGSSQ